MHQSLWLFHDLTERIHIERQISHMAYHDTLTQLPNRHRVDVVLNEWMASTQSIGCIVLNVDRMKFINDMLGHQAGNLLLQHIAERLSGLLEKGDFLARFGGDEFIILLANERVNTVEEIAKRCVEQMREPFIVHGHPISITMSAGLCTYPSEASNADELLQYADLAMSESKKNGKNEATAFTLSLNEQYRRKLQIEEALTTAQSHGELHLVYQPKIRMRTEKMEGVEALLRWTHPEHGPISPVEFIPIAEEKGLIHTIGEWVLRASCSQWVSWSREVAEPPIVAVNISPIQLTRDDFLPTLLEIIEETAMDPRFLELEITESASLGFEEKSRALLEKNTDIGNPNFTGRLRDRLLLLQPSQRTADRRVENRPLLLGPANRE